MSVNDNLTNVAPGSLNIDRLVQEATPSFPQKIRIPTRREEKELAQKQRKRVSLRYRKPYTRKRGTVHPKRKEATLRRNKERLWREAPFWCVVYGYGAYDLDREKWDRYIAPFWEQYDPKDLEVKRYGRPYGTKANPYTVYTLDLVHKTAGILYCGNDQLLYDLSSL